MITYASMPPDHPGHGLLSGDTIWLAAQADPRFSYGLHVPATHGPGQPTPVVVVVHGTQREAQELRREWSEFSEHSGAVVVAPLFPAGILDADDIDSYKMIDAGRIRFDHVLMGMLDDIAHRWGLDVSRVHLFGHSGGGQFTQRMLLLHPDRLASAVISAPGRVTLIDPDEYWPRGTGNTRDRFGIDVDPDRIAQVPVLLTAGDRDQGATDLAAQQDDSQTGYGDTRTARLTTLADNLRAHGVQTRIEWVADAGHAGSPTRAIAQEFLDTLIQGDHA